MTPTSGDIAAVISATAQIGMTIAVGIGVIIAHQQLHAWRSEARARRKSEAAIDLIVAAVNVSDALKGIRARVDRIPAEKAKDKKFVYQRRYDRIVDSNELFEGLRQAQIVANAVIENNVDDDAVDALFNIRSEVGAAIESLVDMLEYGDAADGNSISFAERKFIVDMRQTLYGSYDDKDKIGTRQLNAIRSIEEKLGSVARFEGR